MCKNEIWHSPMQENRCIYKLDFSVSHVHAEVLVAHMTLSGFQLYWNSVWHFLKFTYLYRVMKACPSFHEKLFQKSHLCTSVGGKNYCHMGLFFFFLQLDKQASIIAFYISILSDTDCLFYQHYKKGNPYLFFSQMFL